MDDHQFIELNHRLDELEKGIKKLNGQGVSYQITIEHAEIQGPLINKLDYNFDKLDVKEVSGALNLGNNFGVKVGEIKKKESQEEGSSEKEKGQNKNSPDGASKSKSDLDSKSKLTPDQSTSTSEVNEDQREKQQEPSVNKTEKERVEDIDKRPESRQIRNKAKKKIATDTASVVSSNRIRQSPPIKKNPTKIDPLPFKLTFRGRPPKK